MLELLCSATDAQAKIILRYFRDKARCGSASPQLAVCGALQLLLQYLSAHFRSTAARESLGWAWPSSAAGLALRMH